MAMLGKGCGRHPPTPTWILSRMAGLARPVRMVLKLLATTSTAFCMRDSCSRAAVRSGAKHNRVSTSAIHQRCHNHVLLWLMCNRSHRLMA